MMPRVKASSASSCCWVSGPSLLRIRPGLTPLAAAGLIVIMIGATVITLAYIGIASALIPLVVGILAAFVAYGRSRLAPIRPKALARSER